MPQPLTIILFGSAGSGKGTQADYLVDSLGLEHIEAGALVRKTAQEESDFGRHVRTIQDAGHLLPDEDIDTIVLGSIRAVPASHGMLIDGYPRRMAQAKTLEAVLRDVERDKVRALFINVSDTEAKRRMLNRSHCVHGHILIGRNYQTCPIDGAAINVRSDDQDEQAIAQRLALYRGETLPAIEYYRAKGWVIDINGEQSIEAVRDEIFKKLNSE